MKKALLVFVSVGLLLSAAVVVAQDMPEASAVFAHFGAGGGWKTQLIIKNLTVEYQTVTIDWMSPTCGGVGLDTTDNQGYVHTNIGAIGPTIFPNGVYVVTLDAPTLQTGWISIYYHDPGDGTVPILAQEVFFSDQGQATVLPGFPSGNDYGTVYTMPVAFASAFTSGGGPTQMGLAIVNPGWVGNSNGSPTPEITVNIAVLDSRGQLVAKGSKDLKPGYQTSFYLDSMFTLPSDFTGSIIISSDPPFPFLAVGLGLKGYVVNAIPLAPLKSIPAVAAKTP